MATRATVAFTQDDGSFKATYLHYDGYPEHAGVILNQRYNSIETVSALITGGELRCLTSGDGAPEYFPRSRPPIHIHDRGSLLAFARKCDANYLYVFENGQWQCHKM